MTSSIFSQLIDNDKVILQITAGELKEFVKAIYADEQKKIAEAISHHREKPELSRKETAKRLGVSLATLWKWAKDGYLVPAKIGTRVVYRASDVDALLERSIAI